VGPDPNRPMRRGFFQKTDTAHIPDPNRYQFCTRKRYIALYKFRYGGGGRENVLHHAKREGGLSGRGKCPGEYVRGENIQGEVSADPIQTLVLECAALRFLYGLHEPKVDMSGIKRSAGAVSSIFAYTS